MTLVNQEDKFTIKSKVKLGEGNFSIVKLAVHQKTNVHVAAKIIDLLHHHKEFKREVEILKKISHPFIITYHGSEVRTGGQGILFLEFLPHPSLGKHLMVYGVLSETAALRVLRQLVDGIGYLYTKGISHHDVKPDNISYNPDTHTMKLFDFGLALDLDPLTPNTSWDAGSPLYMAPEILLKESHNPFVSDVWSLGITFYEMIVGKTPYNNIRTISSLIKHFRSNFYPPSIPLDLSCSSLGRKICKRMLTIDPESRISIEELKNSLCPPLKRLSPLRTSRRHSSGLSPRERRLRVSAIPLVTSEVEGVGNSKTTVLAETESSL